MDDNRDGRFFGCEFIDNISLPSICPDTMMEILFK